MSGEPSVIAVGNIATNPEVKHLPGGKTVANFSLAVTPRNKVQGEFVDGVTIWFRVAVWGDMAEEVAQAFKKGDKVQVDGYFRAREYYKDGETKVSFDLTANMVTPVAKKSFQQTKPVEDDPWASNAKNLPF